MAISIDTSTFPAEGGQFIIGITKESLGPWNVTVSPAAWIISTYTDNISPNFCELHIDIQANTIAADRVATLTAGDNYFTETFTLVQYGTGTTLSAEVISVTPTGNIGYTGGQITVDIEARNGVDADTTASISTGNAYTTLTSTTHGVSSGGTTVTRFVFSVTANPNTSTRAIELNFTVQDAAFNTASASVNKTQNATPVQSGTLSASDVNAAATDTTASSTLSQTAMDMSSVSGVPSAVWVTAAQIQVQGGQYVCALTLEANTGASSRTTTVVLSGDDLYGNTITATFSVTQNGTSHNLTASWDAEDYMGFEGGTLTATVSYTGTFTGSLEIVSAPGAPTGMAITTNGSTEVRVYWDGGLIPQNASIPITIKRKGDDNNWYNFVLYLRLIVGGVFPIWADAYGEIVSDEAFEDYELDEGGVAFYTGRAFKYPDENSIRVNVSRVVAPYLTEYYKDVDMYSESTLVASFTFVRDYSYDPTIDYSQNQPLSRPINGLIPSGVKMLVSEWGADGTGSLQVTDESGSLVVNEALQKGLNSAEFITGAEGKYYIFGNERFRVVSACRGVLLKYVNAYGGWDFFYVEGVCKKTDKITRASYEKDADALSQQFETTDYQATMEASWQGYTGWLTDSQSARMKHLVESVEVYMLDLSTGVETPVVMRDNSLEYKTFFNGRKLVNYTLQWTESQKKLRR